MLTRLFLVILLICTHCRADTITANTGGTLDCTIVQESKDRVLFIYGEGLMSLPRTLVRGVARDAASVPRSVTGSGSLRLPAWDSVVRILGEQTWATELRQIPATVIDTGVFKSVPYKSFKCGGSYEINVYGDPYNPSAIEIGVYRASTRDPGAKANCVSFMSRVLLGSKDQTTLRSLQLDTDSKEHDGLTFEVTPPTSADSYGGWWISVYDEKLLESARASEQELDAITVSSAPDASPRAQTPSIPKPGATTPSANGQTTDGDDQLPAVINATASRWSREDLREARPFRPSSITKSSTPSHGRVYVRGYYRKDGTYVRPHSRRK